MFEKKELSNIFTTIIIIAIVFAFDDKREKFELGFWTLNFLKTLVFSFITIFSYELAQKSVARLHKAVTYHEISYNIGKKNFPTTIFIAFLTTILTNGKLYFAAIKKTNVKLVKKTLGKQFPNIKESAMARIIVAGPIFIIFLSAIISSLKLQFLEPLKIMLITYSIYNILPIPPLDGSKIFFSSLPLFIFSFVFIIITSLLLFLIPSFIVIIFSMVISLLFFYLALNRLY